MPIPVKYICPKCKGECEMPLPYLCIPCSYDREIVKPQGGKHTVHKFSFYRANGQDRN